MTCRTGVSIKRFSGQKGSRLHRALVSGITGHLGRQLAVQLTASGIETHGLTRKDFVHPPPGLETVRLHRVSDETDVIIRCVCEVQPDIVFHLAAVARRDHQPDDIRPYIETNVLFGTQLLEGMKHSNCRRIVLAGSYLQHFDTDAYRPFNLYAATKQAFEDIVTFYADSYGFSGIRLTLADIYSEHDTRPKLMTDIARAWATGTPLRLHADEAWIDPIHVEDAAAACLRAGLLIEQGGVPSGALSRYSASSGGDISATDIVRLFETLGSRRIRIERTTGGGTLRKIRPRRGESLPGWAPHIPLEHGITRIIKRHAQPQNGPPSSPTERLSTAL